MPEFVLENRDSPEFRELPAFVRGYIEAIFFTNQSCIPTVEFWDEESQERIREGQADGDLPSDAGFYDLHPDTLAAIIDDCIAFQQKAARLLARAYETGEYDEAQAGRDFWFTRCGHGVGYWGREALDDTRDVWREKGSPRIGEPGWAEYAKARAARQSLGDQLSELARKYRERWVSFEQDENSFTGYGSVHIS